MAAKSVWRSHSAFCGRLVVLAVTDGRLAVLAVMFGILWPSDRLGGHACPRSQGDGHISGHVAAKTTLTLPFSKRLVLNQWLLGLFGVARFDDLARHLREESLEGLNEDNVHRFHQALCVHLPAGTRPSLPDDVLLAHDQAITSVTRRLNERRITRGLRPISWKYFQYLALLFTEIYLDWYFNRPRELLEAVNEHVAKFNASVQQRDRVAPLKAAADARQQLNKVVFWMATGSGKTLLMHAHVLRYLELLDVHGRARDLNRIILLTPNEGLSRQHLREFETAGISARIFDKNNASGLFTGQTVDILEVTKLKDEMGDKTVAVDAFEGNNLVLVDEGHRGAATAASSKGGAWMRYRERLCEKGFSFEYSATFGQAVKGTNRAKLANLYARSTLFDYSYRWFYGDGFGKDYRILNLEDDRDAEWRAGYLTACLLVFFQQQRLWHRQESTLGRFNLERPLWVFVGGSVTKSLSQREASDVVAILRFLADYVSDRAASVRRIREVLDEGLGDPAQQEIFTGRFAHLHDADLSAEQVFDETLAVLFNAPNGGALHVENLKGAAGEVALRVGDNDPFGVVNVGDDAKLVKLCGQSGFAVGEREFGDSLFHDLANPGSTVNLLIGSRKFTEGWNSWRVSTMGLMHIGKLEGAQIIQLFGRGVRLKGCDMSLKRSARAQLPEGLKRPDFVETLETLHVFGVRADYMAQFRDFLAEEGLSVDNEQEDFWFPVVKNLGMQPLKTIRLKKVINGVRVESGDAFRKLGPMPVLRSLGGMASDDPARSYLHERVVLDWYPKIKALKSEELSDVEAVAEKHEAKLEEVHTAFLDLDRLYFELERFKSERGWHNLSVSRTAIRELLEDGGWYRLLIPKSQMAADSFDKVRLWDQIALALLKKYVERYYTFRKNDWERRHLEYAEVTPSDANFPMVREKSGEYGYRIAVDKSKEEIVATLRKVEAAIERGDLKDWAFPGLGLHGLSFDRHLYTPLLAVDGAGVVEVEPAPLNRGERRFVEDLKAYCEGNSNFFKDRELYLLRNLSRGRGIGFFEAGNFHPDFILWLLADGRQYVTFVDPKGLVQLGVDNEKVDFYKTIKEIEDRLGDPNMVLNSYIVSVSSSQDVKRRWGRDKSWLTKRNVVFQNEDRDSYIGTMLSGVVGDDGSG